MKDKYLGDSYDLVKKFWADCLRPIAPLYAHPIFVPAAIRDRYSTVTTIPILDTDQLPRTKFGLLLDPNTGVPLPSDISKRPSMSHAPLPHILELVETLSPTYLICFDQSYHRSHAFKRPDQLKSKQEYLKKNQVGSFYYDSHAPFLFLARDSAVLSEIKKQLLDVGIPADRLK